ncbi:hypothetical protein F5890DRAFT_1539746 [Lentinula detonsa]|uniref:Uncharacterized protein n=1 Tax=Lentinula detonsa TaxID=2804962 RepID=A0AA38PSB2_9AGAR|nr:hypothetical protein F5890DRAFT_1539746 [Lentinula detonsa]
MSYSSIESLRHSVDNCQNRDALSPNKKIDLYEIARIDPELPIETIMINLITLRDEGEYMDIHSLSEYKSKSVHGNAKRNRKTLLQPLRSWGSLV